MSRLLVLVVLAGCADSGSHHPGPCTAYRDDAFAPLECTFAYDGDGRLATTTCQEGEGFSGNTTVVTRSYTGGELTGVTVDGQGDGALNATWTFGDTIEEDSQASFYDSLTSLRTQATYERDGFQLVGHLFDVEATLEAPDAMLAYHNTRTNGDADPPVVTQTDVTYTFDSPPRQGTRTRTGSDTNTATFTYDASGRLLEQYVDHGAFTEAITYEYENALLTRIVSFEPGTSATIFAYDQHDNLIRKENPNGVTEFGYDCW